MTSALQSSIASAAIGALIEAQVMSESIRALIQRLIDDGSGDSATLEAVVACTHRLEAAVDPIIEQEQQR